MPATEKGKHTADAGLLCRCNAAPGRGGSSFLKMRKSNSQTLYLVTLHPSASLIASGLNFFLVWSCLGLNLFPASPPLPSPACARGSAGGVCVGTRFLLLNRAI